MKTEKDIANEFEPCGFPVKDCLIPQPKISQCRECNNRFADLRGECPVCYYRKMAANYGFLMQHFRDGLTAIDRLDKSPARPLMQIIFEIEGITEVSLRGYGEFNLRELFADCLLLLTEESRIFSLFVALDIDLPDLLVDELGVHTKFIKELVKKFAGRDVLENFQLEKREFG